MQKEPVQKKMNAFTFPWRPFSLPTLGMSTTLVIYLALSVGLAQLMALPLVPPEMGLIGAIVINLIVIFFVWSSVALPLYLLVAGPSVALSLSSSGVLSRLYIGNLLFLLVTIIWILLRLLPNRKSGRPILPPSLLAPLLSLITVGFVSIVSSRLSPDPKVTYSFPHATTNLLVVNAAELMLLIGLPMFLVVVPGIVSAVRHVRWVILAYMVVGLLYALGTIFAAPLGLYSKEVILGVRRPQVFGSVSSGLGTLIVLFASIAFCQVLYSRTRLQRTLWTVLTVIFCTGVIMTFGRESWIALFLSLLAATVIYSKNWKILMIAIIIPLLFFLIPGATDFFDPTKTYGTDRFKIWQDAINIWLLRPSIGVGAGNYQFFDLTYGIDVVGVAHNQYLQVLAEMGVAGFACLIWAMAAVGWVSVRSFRSAKTRLGKSLALAYLCYFVSIIFGGLFTSSFVPSAADGGGTASFVEESYRWILLGLVLSIPNWDTEQELVEAAASEADEQEASIEPQETAAITR